MTDLYAPAQPRPGQEQFAADPMAGFSTAGTGATPGARLDPALVALILKQQNAGAANSLKRRADIAQFFRAQASDQMQTKSAGRYLAAPGLANLAASVYGNYKANQADKQAQGTADGVDRTASEQARAYFAAMGSR